MKGKINLTKLSPEELSLTRELFGIKKPQPVQAHPSTVNFHPIKTNLKPSDAEWDYSDFEDPTFCRRCKTKITLETLYKNDFVGQCPNCSVPVFICKKYSHNGEIFTRR